MANTIENLKIIFDMQREGVINGMHKSVRDSKADIDNFAKKLSARKREIEFLKEREVQAEKVKAEPIEAEKPPKVEEKEQVKETEIGRAHV